MVGDRPYSAADGVAATRLSLLIAVLIMALSQLCGINAVIYYSTKIFAAAGATVPRAFSRRMPFGDLGS